MCLYVGSVCCVYDVYMRFWVGGGVGVGGGCMSLYEYVVFAKYICESL